MSGHNVLHVGVLTGSFVLHFIVIGLSFSFGILYSELHSEFGVSQSDAAWIASMFIGLTSFAGVPVSFFEIRYGDRKLAIFGSLVLFVGMLTSAFVTSFGWFYITYGLIGGLGASICMMPGTNAVMKSFTTRRPLAIAIATSGSAIGNLALPPLLTLMLSKYGWRGTFLLLGGLALHGVPASLLLEPDSVANSTLGERPTQSIADQHSIKESTVAVSKNRPFLLFAASIFVCRIVMYVPVTFLPDLMKELSFSDREIYIVAMVVGTGHLIGRILPGLLNSVLRLDLLTMNAIVLLAGAISTAVMYFVESFTLFTVMAIVVGMVSGAFNCLLISICPELLEREDNDVGFGWLKTLSGIAIVFGMPFAGFLVDLTETQKTAYPVAGIFMLLSLVLSLITQFTIRKTTQTMQSAKLEGNMDIM